MSSPDLPPVETTAWQHVRPLLLRLLAAAILALLLVWGLGAAPPIPFWDAAIYLTAILVVLCLAATLWWLARQVVIHRGRMKLRTLLLIVAIVGGGCGIGGQFLQSSSKQRAALQAILSSGAKVSYTGKLGSGPKAILDRAFFDEVISVDWECSKFAPDLRHLGGLSALEHLLLRNAQVNDQAIARLPALPRLYELGLDNTSITGDGLEHLIRLPQLRSLAIRNADLQITGLTHVAQLRRLQYLHLHRCSIGDQDLKHLAALRPLLTLELEFTQITDAGLAHLKSLPILDSLSLRGTTISDEGLRHVSKLPFLRILRLESPAVTDAGLQHLRNLKNLELLELQGMPAVTDAGLQHLRNLKKLANIQLQGTKVTPQGIEMLRNALPDSRINE